MLEKQVRIEIDNKLNENKCRRRDTVLFEAYACDRYILIYCKPSEYFKIFYNNMKTWKKMVFQNKKRLK